MTLSSLTKAQLVLKVREAQGAQVREREAAEALRSELEQVRGELSAAAEKLHAALVQSKVPEADALAGCIRALDGIPRQRPANSYLSGRDADPDQATIRRVLVHLGDRYGVPLIETTTEPCSRQHLDEVDGFALQAALRGAVIPQ